MSQYSHVPIYDVLSGNGQTLAEFENVETKQLRKMMARGRFATLVDRDTHATVYVSDNRYVMDCPICESGLYISEHRTKWPCWDCGTVIVADWPSPSELAAIRPVLLERIPRLRYWFPEGIAERFGRIPDTAESLIWENDTYGLDHHSWTTPRTWVTAEMVTAVLMNQAVRDNFLETCPALVTTEGDITVATGANALARLGEGADNEYLRVITGTVLWWT